MVIQTESKATRSLFHWVLLAPVVLALCGFLSAISWGAITGIPLMVASFVAFAVLHGFLYVVLGYILGIVLGLGCWMAKKCKRCLTFDAEGRHRA